MIGIGDFALRQKNKKVELKDNQMMFEGKKYRQDKETGYWVCTTAEKSGNRKRLHVAMWESFWGWELPPGCVVHHKDWVKTHNEVSNFLCLTQDEHNSIHNPPGGGATPEDERVLERTAELEASRVDGLPPGIEGVRLEKKKNKRGGLHRLPGI